MMHLYSPDKTIERNKTPIVGLFVPLPSFLFQDMFRRKKERYLIKRPKT